LQHQLGVQHRFDDTAPAAQRALADPEHAARVARVAAQLRAWPAGQPLSLRKRAPAHQVPKLHDLRRRDTKLDVGDLDRILALDPLRRVCVAEPGATFDAVVRACLAHGLMPMVVPELASITVGGAVAGCALESTSFRRGGFHDTCLAYEVITTAGDVLYCTPDNRHALVFEMMHGSFGTLGILSALVFRLAPTKRYVAMRYTHHDTLDRYLDAIVATSRPDSAADFIDGILHTPTCNALAVGTFCDAAPYHHAYDWTRVYYRSTRERDEDYLATYDYLFRYDRGVTSVTPSSWLGRLVLGKLATSARVMWLVNHVPRLIAHERPTVTLDVFVPLSRVPRFLRWYEHVVGHYPLWCVPYRRVRDYPWLAPSFYAGMTDELFLDLAIYGLRQYGGPELYRQIEQELREVGGIKTLIAHNYYSEDEFWQIWNRDNHQAVKAITDPRGLLRDLYEKTCRAAMGIPPRSA
jgi:FAD/FMN-containing dehydrogenase